VYTSFLSGPRRADEIDGPDEFHVVLLDNGRTRLLPNPERRQSLYCIRCGACLNACPVYRKIGGHSFPWVYSGPIGAIITPQFLGAGHEPELPFASSLCGACAEVCPVKIDIPKVLLDLRSEVASAKTGRLEKLAFRAFAWLARHPRVYAIGGRLAASLARSGDGAWIRRVPALLNVGPIRAWLSQRDLPPPPPRSFRQLWRQR
jgi:L-lactate dehydrogenase complex protein LldF